MTKAARAALRAWPGVAAGTAEALAGRPVALFAESPPGTPARRLLTALSRGFEVLDAALAPVDQDAAARAHGCFSDIRLRPITFLRHVHGARRVLAALGRTGEARFLDVGCGAGTKVVLAAAFFAHADGLELDPGYAAVAGRLLGTRHAPRTGLLAGDALAFDAYAGYDVIYFYQPMRDDTKLAALERRIALAAKPGTVLIAPYESFAQRAADLPVAPLAGWLWVAGYTRAAAEALRRAAERSGLALPDPGRPPPREGLLGALAEALRRAGHLE
jgi:SAM-dependent methyltransferase